LRTLIPEIDYRDAGLTDADLSMIGVDFLMPSVSQQQAEAEITQMLMPDMVQPAAPQTESEPQPCFEDKVQHMKDVKAQVQQQAMQRAADNSAYVMLSFDNWTNLQDFLAALDLEPNTQIIKGEELATMLFAPDEEE